MSRTYRAEAILSARDAMAPGLRSAARRLQHFQQQVDRANRMTARAETRMRAMRAMEHAPAMGAIRGLMGPLAAAVGVHAVAQSARRYGDWDERLRRFQNTAEITKEQLGQLEAQVRKTGHAVGLSAEDVFGGPEKLLAGGMSFEDALKRTDTIARVAKAYAASTEEIGASTLSMANNLKIGDEQLPVAFNHLAKATKLGSIEFNAFAKWLPSLSGRMQALGITGMDAVDTIGALAQAAGKTAASDDDAMNNLVNFVDKLSAPDTRKKLSKMGVNIEEIYKKSKKNGTDFVRDMIQVLAKLTKGDAFKMGEIFGDRQARDAALALIQNLGEVQRNLGEMRNATGVVDRDLANVLEGPKAKVAQLASAWDNFKQHLLQPVAAGGIPILNDLNHALDKLERGETILDRIAAERKAREEGAGLNPSSGDQAMIERLIYGGTEEERKQSHDQIMRYLFPTRSDIDDARFKAFQDGLVEREAAENEILNRPKETSDVLARRVAHREQSRFDWERRSRDAKVKEVEERLALQQEDARRIHQLRHDRGNRVEQEAAGLRNAIDSRNRLITSFDPNAPLPPHQGGPGPGILNFGFGPNGTGGPTSSPGQPGDVVAKLEGQVGVHNTVEIKLDSNMLRAEIRSVVKEEVGPIRTQSTGSAGGLNTGRSMPEAGGY